MRRHRQEDGTGLQPHTCHNVYRFMLQLLEPGGHTKAIYYLREDSINLVDILGSSVSGGGG